MDWKGVWKNQYGSVVDIIDDANNRISGYFKTALSDSGFYGQSIPIVGVYQGECVCFAGGGETTAGDALVSYTGLYRDGRMETLWFVVADSALKASAPESEPKSLSSSRGDL